MTISMEAAAVAKQQLTLMEMDGDIAVKSEPGSGSSFAIEVTLENVDRVDISGLDEEDDAVREKVGQDVVGGGEWGGGGEGIQERRKRKRRRVSNLY